ncbi:hypothetical protein [Alteromonas sp. ASW11-130]|uniref:hypothetical protein n=1 Tax=Alteromonas sp. ASW11-130 TaxID=3015775 RepID=UPI002241FF3E|nr:hypothetical protein [Alteromonas sp. ASW11-130]MCW8091681.1 hypothetical protein [Alteromonas sp. ASW11-130]
MKDPAIHYSLLSICKQLQEKGIKPTASLVRAKAHFNVNIADAITAIKAFHSDDDDVLAAQPEVMSDPVGRIEQLEKRVAQLEKVLRGVEKYLSDQERV